MRGNATLWWGDDRSCPRDSLSVRREGSAHEGRAFRKKGSMRREERGGRARRDYALGGFFHGGDVALFVTPETSLRTQ